MKRLGSPIRRPVTFRAVGIESVVCFVLWVVYGWTVWRRGPQIRARFSEVAKNKRVILAIWLMIGGLIALILGLFGAVSMTGPKVSFGPIQWLIVAIVGGIFVHSQTLAAAIMTTLIGSEVTAAASETSQQQETRDR